MNDKVKHWLPHVSRKPLRLAKLHFYSHNDLPDAKTTLSKAQDGTHSTNSNQQKINHLRHPFMIH